MGKSKKKVINSVRSIVDDYKLNNSAYIIQDYVRRHQLAKKIKNTAIKLKREAPKALTQGEATPKAQEQRPVKTATTLIEHNIKYKKPIFTPMTQEEANKIYQKELNRQKKITNYFKPK